MMKRFLMGAAVVLLAAGIGMAQDKPMAKAKTMTWHGWVTDTECGAKGANAKHADCAAKCVKEKGAKYALYNTADKKVYVLDNQEEAAEHAGHHVTVKGTLDGDTIHVASITMPKAKPAADKKTSM
jgi:hypothetical protein